ncbi:MerR family transcriptional regulator [Anaeromicrobium sediminis]|uniref:HTH merR-type domain-containing protein n=1 Tax=Anaeromicrobium sediminis TaxID=1478221 RepID=A0A267M8U5_9FIRM|nr:MerR family transcriptional regulator [Anaeromicrobium sediminis]PAB55996.1 hypothetical protein CCE28_21345 [Anaeromicrobium sediminis]
MYTIRDLVQEFKLSRSTILYYDKLGLLKPSERAENNYRLYSDEDLEKLRNIVMYREAGISLKEISKLLNIDKTQVSDILIHRLKRIQNNISALKKQEKMALEFLKEEVLISNKALFDNHTWTELLSSLGFNEEDLILWHQEFEKNSPEDHEAFLKAIGMSNTHIKKLRMQLIK